MINEKIDYYNTTINRSLLISSLLLFNGSNCFAESQKFDFNNDFINKNLYKTQINLNEMKTKLEQMRVDIIKSIESSTLLSSTNNNTTIVSSNTNKHTKKKPKPKPKHIAKNTKKATLSKRKYKNTIKKKKKSKFSKQLNNDIKILKSFNINSSYLNNKLLNKEIKNQLHYKKPRLNHFLNSNKKYYISKIAEILNKNHKRIPKYMMYLALNESNFNLKSLSNKYAVGIWQFTKNTGKLYNLKINKNIDERRNVTKSSLAAINYLKDLNQFFKSWHLSIMAYNAGPNRVIEAFARAGVDKECFALGNKHCLKNKRLKRHFKTFDLYKKKKVKFLEINKIYNSVKKSKFKPTLNDLLNTYPHKKRQYLPLETRNYIKRIVASSIVFKDTLLNFNYHKKHSKKYTGAPLYTYSVKRGDSLSKISKKFGISYTNLMKMNSLKSSKILVNQKLKIY